MGGTVIVVAVWLGVLIVAASAWVLWQCARASARASALGDAAPRAGLSVSQADTLAYALGVANLADPDLGARLDRPWVGRNRYPVHEFADREVELIELLRLGYLRPTLACVTPAGFRALRRYIGSGLAALAIIGICSAAWAQPAPVGWVSAIGPDGTCGQVPADHPAASAWRRVARCPGADVVAVAGPGAAVDPGPTPWLVGGDRELQIGHTYRDPYNQIMRVIAEVPGGWLLEQRSCNGGAWGALWWREAGRGRWPWWEVAEVAGGAMYVGDLAVGGQCRYVAPVPEVH